jgi:hypothetical protein
MTAFVTKEASTNTPPRAAAERGLADAKFNLNFGFSQPS